MKKESNVNCKHGIYLNKLPQYEVCFCGGPTGGTVEACDGQLC